MRSLIANLQQQHASLKLRLDDKDEKHPGMKAVLVGNILSLERRMRDAMFLFQHHVPDIDHPPHAYLSQDASPNSPCQTIYSPLSDDDNDDDDD